MQEMPEWGFPIPPFQYDDEARVMAHFYGYCDESGKFKDHAMVVFNGLVNNFKMWTAFGEEWMRLLRHYGLSDFHAFKALKHHEQYGTMKPGTAEDRANDVMPFVRAIVERVEFGVVAAVDVKAYMLASLQLLRQKIADDPHYFAFYAAVSAILKHWTVPPNYLVGLILDDDEDKAIPVYQFLRRMKRANDEVRKRVTSICFSNDKSSPAVQAADLFSYLTRRDAQRIFLGIPHPYAALCDAFQKPVSGKEILEIGGGIFQEEQLKDYMEKARKKYGS